MECKPPPFVPVPSSARPPRRGPLAASRPAHASTPPLASLLLALCLCAHLCLSVCLRLLACLSQENGAVKVSAAEGRALVRSKWAHMVLLTPAIFVGILSIRWSEGKDRSDIYVFGVFLIAAAIEDLPACRDMKHAAWTALFLVLEAGAGYLGHLLVAFMIHAVTDGGL